MINPNNSLRLFTAWDKTSAVRCRPYRYTLSESDLNETDPERWFPKILIPLLTTPQIKVTSKQALLEIHIGHLLHFLDYTTDLEISYVNRAVSGITHGSLKSYFHAEEHLAALKLYTDEGYHALFSKALADQVAQHFLLPRQRSLRLKRLDKLLLTHSAKQQSIVEFLIGFVSETLIVRELSWLSKDDLIPPVFHIFHDHLLDEAKHSVFFADAFVTLWGQLSSSDRDFVVSTLITVIHVFFRPDASFIKAITSKHLLDAREALQVMRTSWKSRIASTSTLTMRALQRTDLLESPGYVRALRLGGLIT